MTIPHTLRRIENVGRQQRAHMPVGNTYEIVFQRVSHDGVAFQVSLPEDVYPRRFHGLRIIHVWSRTCDVGTPLDTTQLFAIGQLRVDICNVEGRDAPRVNIMPGESRFVKNDTVSERVGPRKRLEKKLFEKKKRWKTTGCYVTARRIGFHGQIVDYFVLLLNVERSSYWRAITAAE